MTTDFADMYVEFRPGSDLAIANGIIHLLFEQGKLDNAFIQENVIFKRGIGGRPQWDDETREWVRDQLAEDTTTFLRRYGKAPDYWG